MTLTNKTIDKIVHTLIEAEKNFDDPSVTLVGKKWKNPFLVLISCILSLRTQDRTTIPASERLFALADNPQKMLTLSVKEIEQAVYPVSFYRNKSRSILGICRDLLEHHKGQVPDDLEALLKFKGVGRKTANLVLTEGFAKPGVCVDTHVHRISNRLGYVKTKTPLETEMALRKKLPEKHWLVYNPLLVVWGQNICKPISPFCSRCAIRKYCERRGVVTSR